VWDEQVVVAYRESFDQFMIEHSDIEVRVNVVVYLFYFDFLRIDVVGDGVDDVFWFFNVYFAGYVDNSRLLDVGRMFGSEGAREWESLVVWQFTCNGVLWGVF
ncbi:MAG: hypothetical protein O7C59_08705, partial [Rickettsia endosymbiont of Ixodes persulcatus]|nr:hypothetical protein [Rickettsia endosymbiont of Ixodes persulcatus]